MVKTGKYRSLGEDPQPFMYQSYWQNYVPGAAGGEDAGRLSLGARRHAARNAGPGPEVGGLRRDVEAMKKLMLLPLFRPLGKNRANSVRQAAVLLLRRTAQLLPKLRLNERSNQFTTRAHAHGLTWQALARQRTMLI